MNWDRFNKTYLILSHAQVFKAKGMNDYFMVKTHTKLYIVKKHIYNFKKFKKSIFHHFPSFKLQRCVLFFIFMFLYFLASTAAKKLFSILWQKVQAPPMIYPIVTSLENKKMIHIKLDFH